MESVTIYDNVEIIIFLMAQSQCRRSVGDQFWPGVVVENKESLNNPSNNPNKSGAVTLSEIFSRILTRFCRKIVGLASDRHLQQERLKLLAIRSEAPLYTRRFTTIAPYDSSETITETVRTSQGASDSVGGRRRLLADIESQPEFPIPHRILRLVSDYSEDASD